VAVLFPLPLGVFPTPGGFIFYQQSSAQAEENEPMQIYLQ